MFDGGRGGGLTCRTMMEADDRFDASWRRDPFGGWQVRLYPLRDLGRMPPKGQILTVEVKSKTRPPVTMNVRLVGSDGALPRPVLFAVPVQDMGTGGY